MFYAQMEEGSETALKDYYRQCQDQLDELVKLTVGELSKGDRKKVITLCTIDTHARDVVQKLIDDKVESGAAFQWQSQLRYSFDEATKAVRGSICDFDFPYAYEYVGNCGCLVITPLTDRCYITLTQAQRLVLGGAPAGPAGQPHAADAVLSDSCCRFWSECIRFCSRLFSSIYPQLALKVSFTAGWCRPLSRRER